MSATLRPDDLAIDRLRLCGPAAARAHVQRELVEARWPQAQGESWVLIRRVQVRAPLPGVTRLLLEETRQMVTHAGDRSDDNVVRFANHGELVAALLADVAGGVAAQRWYWQAWSRILALPRAQALAKLMTEHLALLPSLCVRLAQIQALPAVWQALDDRAAQQLSAEFAWRAGVRLPSEAEVAAVAAGNTREIVALPPAALARWAQVWRVLPASDARRRLALLIVAQEVAPLALRQAPAHLLARWDAHIAQVFGHAAPERYRESATPEARTGSALDQAGAKQVEVTPGTTSPRPSEALASLRAASASASQRDTASVSQQATATSAAVRDADVADELPNAISPALPASVGAHTTQRARENTREAVCDSPHIPGAATDPPKAMDVLSEDATATLSASLRAIHTAAAQRRETPAQRAFDEFRTAQGGLFYLVNFLNRGEAQALVEAHWRELQSGWAWLFRLGQELKLDEHDVVLDFLAQQCGLEDARQLTGLPPLPARAELLALAQRWYGKVDLWRTELLALDARVQYTPSHVDIHAPLSSVRLPVRLAGLDINPGWLPWLGRVVTFHYES